jgi:Bacterial PH domain
MSLQSFALVPPGKFARLFPLFIGVVLPLAVGTAMFVAANGSRDRLVAMPGLLILPLVAGVLAWSMHHRRIEVEDGALILRRRPFAKRVSVAEMDLAQARIVDLDTQRDLQPVLKLAGSGMPGYRIGLFRLRDRRTAWLRLTDWRRVLVLPLRDGKVVLLSAERPEAVLDCLRRAAG